MSSGSPLERLAEFIGCEKTDLPDSVVLDFNLNLARRSMSATSKARAYDRALADVTRLERSLQSCPWFTSSPDFDSLNKFRSDIEFDRRTTDHSIDQFPPQRGKNSPAYYIAQVVANCFRSTNRPLTFGRDPVTGGPSTHFCRSVEFAIKAFGIRGGWRGPAEANLKLE